MITLYAGHTEGVAKPKYILMCDSRPYLEHSFHATESAHNIVAASLVMIHPSTVQLGRWEGQVEVQELIVGFYRHHDEVVNAKQLHLNISNAFGKGDERAGYQISCFKMK